MRNLDPSRTTKAYFEHLCDQVCQGDGYFGYDHCDGYSYGRLLWQLFETEYTPKLPFDDNRADDGLCLRYHFDETGEARTLINQDMGPKCSILELLVGLSLRVEGVLWEEDGVDRPWRWFWMMIDNMGLSGQIDDDRFYDACIVSSILEEFNRCNYDRTGGPFANLGELDYAGNHPLHEQMKIFINRYYYG